MDQQKTSRLIDVDALTSEQVLEALQRLEAGMVQGRTLSCFANGPGRYSSKPACSGFTSVRGIAALASSRAEPVVVCCSSSFGGWRFFAATSVADGELVRAPDLTPWDE